ncbi:hypothetical protein ASF34_01220 [Methylobacterium sp. Leaf106]|nr:hypothetical protein ASF34_01220 [Methylobacterium sp. Leaf106]
MLPLHYTYLIITQIKDILLSCAAGFKFDCQRSQVVFAISVKRSDFKLQCIILVLQCSIVILNSLE